MSNLAWQWTPHTQILSFVYTLWYFWITCLTFSYDDYELILCLGAAGRWPILRFWLSVRLDLSLSLSFSISLWFDSQLTFGVHLCTLCFSKSNHFLCFWIGNLISHCSASKTKPLQHSALTVHLLFFPPYHVVLGFSVMSPCRPRAPSSLPRARYRYLMITILGQS